VRTIEQTLEFVKVSPEVLFDTYLDPGLHAKAIEAPVVIGADAGARFEAFGGRVRGSILLVRPKRLIVQTWRGTPWTTSDPDSILTLCFEPTPGGARLLLTQALVPDAAYDTIEAGWHTNYWSRWRRFLTIARQGEA
jgi:activator of HSP90 ATPase